MSGRERLQAAWARRIVVAIALTAAATVASSVLGADALVRGANLLVGAWWLAFLLLLPAPLGLSLLVGSAGCTALLSAMSRTKAEITHLPLTAFDMRLALSYPAGFLDAMKITGWERAALYAALSAGLAALALMIAWHMVRAYLRSRESGAHTLRTASLYGITAVLIVTPAAMFMNRLPDFVDRSSFEGNLWEPWHVFLLEREMGTVPFLWYSYALERRGRGNLIFEAEPRAGPDPDRIAHAAAQVLQPVPKAADRLPNIVLVMMESTFDVNAAFALATPVTNRVFDREHALAYGMLRVNAVGAGSWISEFESLTGVDARLFGFSGYYTHAAVSPYMRGSLVTWLRERGYRTAAYYSVDGTFYNARRAYMRYGFDAFLDSNDLGFAGWSAPDSTIARHYLAHLEPDDRPFFAFFVLTENHAPHRCPSGTTIEELPVRFSRTAELGPTCELNEFVRILGSTGAALLDTERRLRELETQTGRPYILVAYGDHQPHTFTGSGSYAHDYTPHRRAADLNQTMYMIHGTAPTPFRSVPERLPLTVLPTLISGFVASGPADLYLGANLLLLSACGSDMLADDVGFGHAKDGPDPTRFVQSAACAAALDDAIAAYHDAGLFRLLGGDDSGGRGERPRVAGRR